MCIRDRDGECQGEQGLEIPTPRDAAVQEQGRQKDDDEVEDVGEVEQLAQRARRDRASKRSSRLSSEERLIPSLHCRVEEAPGWADHGPWEGPVEERESDEREPVADRDPEWSLGQEGSCCQPEQHDLYAEHHE